MPSTRKMRATKQIAIIPHPHPIIIPSITSPIRWFAIAKAFSASCNEREPGTEACELIGSSASIVAASVPALALASELEVAGSRRQMTGR